MLWIIFVLGLLAMSVDMFPYRTLMTEKEKVKFKQELAEKHSSKVSPSVAAYLSELREFEESGETSGFKKEVKKEKATPQIERKQVSVVSQKTPQKKEVKEVDVNPGKVIKLPVKEQWEQEYEQMMMTMDEHRNQYTPEPIAASDDLDIIDDLIEEQLSLDDLGDLDSED